MLERALLVLAVAAAGAWGGASAGGRGGASAPGPAEVPIEIVDLPGLERALAEQRGSATLLNFWATWCEPCVAELPALLEVARDYRERGGRVLGVSYDLMIPGVERAEVAGLLRAFLVQRDLALPTLVFEAPDFEAINARFGLPGPIPVTLAFDREGRLVEQVVGESSRERFEELMRRALGL